RPSLPSSVGRKTQLSLPSSMLALKGPSASVLVTGGRMRPPPVPASGSGSGSVEASAGSSPPGTSASLAPPPAPASVLPVPSLPASLSGGGGGGGGGRPESCPWVGGGTSSSGDRAPASLSGVVDGSITWWGGQL